MTIQHFVLQIAIILLVARACGAALRSVGQPEVIGEMIGGLLLGPSALGLLWHGAVQNWLFPKSSMPLLNLLASLGVIFFMFIVGLELDIATLRGKGTTVVATGLSSLLGPFICGLVIAWGILHFHFITTTEKSPLAFILMAATAMAMTAFPVLARVISDLNLGKTSAGLLAIPTAAVLDVAGWCLLAVVYDLARADLTGNSSSILGSVWVGGRTAMLAAAYVIVMMFVVRRFLWRFYAHFEVRGRMTRNVLAITLFMLLMSGLVTEVLGINAIFGAFMMGLIFPADEAFVRHITSKLEDITLLVLMPIFFATVGLHTNIAGLAGENIWRIWLGLAGLLFLIKFLFSAAPAWFLGAKAVDSAKLGLLMNTHGVVELVVLSLAWQMHAIHSHSLALLILVFLTITIFSSGLTRLIEFPAQRRKLRQTLFAQTAADPGENANHLHVLIPLSQPDTAALLVKMATSFMAGKAGRITALRMLEPGNWQLAREVLGPAEVDPLDAATREAERHHVAIQPLSFPSRTIARDICRVAQHQHADWILLGAHRGILNPSAIGGVVRQVLKKSPCHVGILINKGLGDLRRVLVPYLGEPQDIGALLAAQLLSRSESVQITILHVVKPERTKEGEQIGVKGLVDRFLPNPGGGNNIHMQVIPSENPPAVVVEQSRNHDLIVLGISPLWKLRQNLLGRAPSFVAQMSGCSILVVQTAGGSQAATPAVAAEKAQA